MSSPQHSYFFANLTAELYLSIEGTLGTHIRCKQPLTIPGTIDEIFYDFVIIESRPEYLERHPYPSEAILVVHMVSEELNERQKQGFLEEAARYGINNLWVVDTLWQQLECYSNIIDFNYLNKKVYSESFGPVVPGGWKQINLKTVYSFEPKQSSIIWTPEEEYRIEL